MDTILIMAVTGALCIVCFFVGAKVGQSVATGKELKAPNPVAAIENYKAEKEAKSYQDEIETMLDNIDAYDGTGNGQKDV